MINLNKTVAVVDDDESVRRALKRLLRSAGVEAETFSSGESL
ncbi:MAG: response regulator, partial [Paraburkholderia caledonica]